MERADLVYKLVDELEPVLEKYASTGIEVAVLISKVNDNVVGYQGTKLGKDFLEQNTFFTETFRKFCKDYWYGADNVATYPTPIKKMKIQTSDDEHEEMNEIQDVDFLSGDNNSVLSGLEGFALLDGQKISISTLISDVNEVNKSKYVLKTSKLITTPKTPKQPKEKSMVSEEKKKITRKAKYRCHICVEAYFRRPHRLNIHMHEYHSKELSEIEMEAYPLPEGYQKRVEIPVKKENEKSQKAGPKKKITVTPFDEKKHLTYRYQCDECNIKFKKVEKFNMHRIQVHNQEEVNEDYGICKDGYQCKYCPKIFASRWNLQRHIDIHLGRKRFKCDECDKFFFRREELARHKVTHTGKKDPMRGSYGKIQCYSCGEPMRLKAGENCSIPSAHDNLREKVAIESIYKCKHCDAAYKDQAIYLLHLAEHEGKGKEVLSEHDYMYLTDPAAEDEAEREDFSPESMEVDADVSKVVDKEDGEIEPIGTTNDDKSDIENLEYQQEDSNEDLVEEGEITPTIIKIDEDLNKPRKRFTKLNYEGAFKCKTCSKSFVTRFVLDRHMMIHTGSKKFECKICESTYSRKDLMERHMKKKHYAEKVLKCNICNIICKDEVGLKYHKSVKHEDGDVKLECTVCSATFSRIKSLRKHNKKCQEKVDEDFKAIIVKQEVTTPVEERSSSRKRKPQTWFGFEDDNEPKSSTNEAKVQKTSTTSPAVKEKAKTPKSANSSTDKKEKTLQNPHAIEGFEFSISDKAHENYTCNICVKSFRYQSEFVSHQLIHSNKKVYPCAMCSLVFLTPMNFKKHLEKHNNNGHFACDSCTFLTDSMEHLSRHKGIHKEKTPSKQESTGNTKDPIICEECGKECTNIHRLKQHQLIHSGEKPHVCSTCDVGFRTLDTLKNHEKTHLEGKPYLCDECGRSFHQMSTLLTHRLIHEKAKFDCQLCTTKFKRRSGLKHHMISIHSNHPDTDIEKALKCQTCDRLFPTKKSLDGHQRIHSGEKPYKCRVCNKSFADGSNRNNHEKTHINSAKKHQCFKCDKSYTHRRDLIVHIEKLHKDEDKEEAESQKSSSEVDLVNNEMGDNSEVDVVTCEKGGNSEVDLTSETGDNTQVDAVISVKGDNSVCVQESVLATLNLERCDSKVKSSTSPTSDQTTEESKLDGDSVEQEGADMNSEQEVADMNISVEINEEQTDQENNDTDIGSLCVEPVQDDEASSLGPVDQESTVTNTNLMISSQQSDNAETQPQSIESTTSLAVKSLSASPQVTGLNEPQLQSEFSDLSVEAQSVVQNVLLHSSDSDNGPSTIYVVQSETEGGAQPEVLYLITEKQQ
ncbi:zinc finger protein 43-like [Mytilus edulis]|uniref:zinc finger protein 43-like n=1 Tax=Mytilus edulis TaxID=6550 RepID=UPI0039F07247